MKSKVKLFQFLQVLCGMPYVGLNSPGVSNETYGKRSCIYLNAKDFGFERRVLECKLIDKGFKVNQGYFPASQIIEVTVSYFKGWHWDE